MRPTFRLVAVTTTAALGVLAAALPALAAPASGAGSSPHAAPEAERHRCTSSVPYVSGEGGYDTYRIPAAVTTPAGTVLAFAEGRVGGAGDSGDIDVVVRRSTDGGCTWGPLSVVAAGQGDTRGNPTPVVDPATGRLVLLTCYNSGAVSEAQIVRGEVTPEQSRRVFVQYSEDDGRTFSAPREITGDVKPGNWRWYATGPGHATALTRGPHAGRLVVPANHSIAPPEGSADTGQEPRYYGSHALYSDDGGLSWRVGYVDATYDGYINSNESSAAQLPDGRVYFSSRDQNGSSPGNRVDAYSADGGESLVDGTYAVQETLGRVPVVQAAVLQTSWRGGPLLFSGPSNPSAREAMTLWRSDDAGRTFRPVTTFSTAPAAYSDLVEAAGHRIGVLYETGAAGPYERIEYRLLGRGEL
ncbi:exo-alpha-sialidase [Streptomyces hoynatensis]|uniref:exo-alpha-sialidase n=1 Tax=Streptomyces hoynatensis TaxID=1141874 RepID=A0A3A9ZJ38_9ACTN|nr:sialidase family protein [Streptomyces hoynatensis]RKN47236.1 exo-alpha-sialidase [Streptomyces hoynatensis]